MHHLFYIDSEKTPNSILISTLKEKLYFRGTFRTIKFEWHKYILTFWILQRFNHTNGYKNFKLVPHYKSGRKHITIDSTALYQYYMNARLHYSYKTWDSFKTVRNEKWNELFNVKNYETKNYKFAYNITTNDVVVCLKLVRQPKNKRDETTFAKHIGNKICTGFYNKFIGCDPGLKQMLALHIRTSSGYQNVKFKANTYRSESGEYKRKKIRLCHFEFKSQFSQGKIF